MHIKINLISLMVEKGWTPQEVSEKTNLTTQTIYSLMNGKKTHLSFNTIATVCEVFECGIEDFLVLVKS